MYGLAAPIGDAPIFVPHVGINHFQNAEGVSIRLVPFVAVG